ncbi:RusA family crossover junction endodeoxyribonuclease [Lysinibacillus antri]|uniref:RusA family crossover junction endodeoxyribonuclease n=1 Tax=Lysinibacillus antri TaxID=2498145 RepID=A0A432LFP3_9BACI|nr:RusA family crossover junction endodeoxyribonuclease [Lysinibacillus antri]RUL56477.1 RusA family crossover junction endodeoxyribonuclease [Lysinibacillus antri]
MGKIQFEIPGDVQAQQRPKFSRAGNGVKAVDPQESRDYKSFVRLVASQHAPDVLITEPIKLTIDVYRKIPKDKQTGPKMKLIGEGKLRPTTKPDIDNLAKGIKDGLSKVLWHDDSQVIELVARKWYSENPRAVVTVEWVL